MTTLIKEHHRSSLVDRGSPLPLFFQVAEDLKRRLREQTYRAGQRFTSVREVASQYGISFVTAQKAMALLADQKLILSRPGRGTVVVRSEPEHKLIEPFAEQAEMAIRRMVLLWPTHLPVAPALQTNLLATMDGLRAALPDFSVALELAGELLLEESAKQHLDSLISGSNFSAFCLVSAPPFVKRYFQQQRVPTVVLGDVESGIELSCVASNEEQAMHDLTQHLIRLGHRRIAQVFGAPRVAGHNERLRGYRRAVSETELGASPQKRTDLEITVPYDRVEAVGRFKALLRGPDPPTAAICTGMPLAAWIKSAAGDRFHVAFDVDRELQVAPPVPSTVLVWPGEQMGRRVGELLTQQIAGEMSIRHEVLGYTRIQDYGGW